MSYSRENVMKAKELFALKRTNAEARAIERKRELADKFPEIGLIDAELARTGEKIFGAIREGHDGIDGRIAALREENELLRRRRAGERVRAVLSYGGNLREVEVELLPRPKFPASGHHTPAAAVGGDRMHRPVVVSDEIRLRFRERRRNICRLLSSLPASLDKDAVVDELQAIRDLARDANPGNAGWMVGRAGVAAVQFRDSQGILLLRGADNQLTLEVFDSAGKMVLRCGLNGAEDYRALPADVLKRLLAL